MNLETELLEITNENLTEAQFMAANFIDTSVQNRVFFNVIGSEAVISYLGKLGIDVEHLSNIHSIKRIVEKVDIGDIFLDNIHIDVRVVFDEKEIFIPKSHYKLGIVPDIYAVLKYDKSFQRINFIGFFEPSEINFNNSNDEYYFIDYARLHSPFDMFDFINNFKGKTDKNLSESQILRGRELSVAVADHDVTDKEFKEFLNLLSKSYALRNSVLEYDNFETLASKVARALQVSQSKSSTNSEVVGIDDFISAEGEKQDDSENKESNVSSAEQMEDLNGDSMLDDVSDDAVSVASSIAGAAVAAGSSEAADMIGAQAVSEEAMDLAALAGDNGTDEVGGLRNQESENQKIQPSNEAVYDGEIVGEDIEDSIEDIGSKDAELRDDIDLDDFEQDIDFESFDEAITENPSEDIVITEEITTEGSTDSEDNNNDVAEIQELDDSQDITEYIEDMKEDTDGVKEDLYSSESENSGQTENEETENADMSIDESSSASGINDEIESEMDTKLEDGIQNPFEDESEILSSEDDNIDPELKEGNSDTVKQDIEDVDDDLKMESAESDEVEDNLQGNVDFSGDFEEINPDGLGMELPTIVPPENSVVENENDDNTHSFEELPTEVVEEQIDSENYGSIDFSDLTDTQAQDSEEAVNFVNTDEFINFDETSPFTGDNENDFSMGEQDIANLVDENGVRENSFVISDKNSTPGEIFIDINKDSSKLGIFSSNEHLEELYNKSKNVLTDESGLNNEVKIGEDKGKTIPLALGIGGIALVIAIAGIIMLSVYRMMNPPQNDSEPLVTDNIPQSNNNLGEDVPNMNIDNNSVIMNDNQTQAPAANNSISKSSAQLNPQNSKPIPATSFLSVRKLSWEVPDYVSADSSFRQYFQSSGKSLKAALSSDLLLATDYTYSDQIRVSILFGSDGTFQRAKILLSSGSSQVDNIVLQSVNQTLKVLKAPNSLGNDQSTTVILKIYL